MVFSDPGQCEVHRLSVLGVIKPIFVVLALVYTTAVVSSQSPGSSSGGFGG